MDEKTPQGMATGSDLAGMLASVTGKLMLAHSKVSESRELLEQFRTQSLYPPILFSTLRQYEEQEPRTGKLYSVVGKLDEDLGEVNKTVYKIAELLWVLADLVEPTVLQKEGNKNEQA